MENLPLFFSALDTVLSLHYSSSTTVPRLHDLCAKATRLTNKRVTPEAVELILAFFPGAYRVLLVGTENYDYGVAAPAGVSPTKFGAMLTERRAVFDERLKRGGSAPAPVKLAAVAVPENEGTTPGCSPRKQPPRVQKSPTKTQKSPSKVDRKELSNTAARYTLKEKDQNTGGLSLLERIRLKEQARRGTDPAAAKVAKHNSHIKSKAPAVYDILYELVSSQPEPGSFQSFSISKVVSIIQDSLDSGLGDAEVVQVLEAVSASLPQKIQILNYKDISAVKIYTLDRDADLRALRNPFASA